jgi:hypothetical protein
MIQIATHILKYLSLTGGLCIHSVFFNQKKSIQQLLKLWYHESCRVFQDRLINDEDRQWFDGLLREKLLNTFKFDYKEIVTNEPVMYCDFMIPNADPRIYSEVDDFSRVCAAFCNLLQGWSSNSIQSLYNPVDKTKPFNND